MYFRDRSLITGRGEHKMGWGACEVLPLGKGGAEKVLEGGVGIKRLRGTFHMVA